MRASLAGAAVITLLSVGGAAAQSTWTLFFVEPNGDRYYVTPPFTPAEDEWSVTVRVEFARPKAVAGIQARSGSETYDFNCTTRQYRQLATSYYAGPNRTGEVRRGIAQPRRPVQAGTNPGFYMRIACVDRGSGAIVPWGSWFNIATTSDGLFVRATVPAQLSWTPVEKSLLVQNEYKTGESYLGIPVGSSVSRYEVRCATRQYRASWTAYYTERDMAGEVRRLAGDAPWATAVAGKVDDAVVVAACGAFTYLPAGPTETSPTRPATPPARPGWTRVFTHPSGNQVFVEPAPPTSAQGVRTIRVRHEYMVSPSRILPYLSTLSTYDVRCAGHEYRQRNITFYEGRNLSGRVGDSAPGMVTFARATAGMVADAIVNAACANR